MHHTDKNCNPFKLSQSQEEIDCGLFRIREQQIDICLDMLKKRHALILSGNPGAGKTSLVRCGLIPSLKKEIEAGGDQMIPINFSPGNAPIARLAKKLSQGGILHEEKDAEDIYSLATEENLRNNERGLIHMLAQAKNPGKRFVFFVDHVEELIKNPEFHNNLDFKDEVRLFFNLFLQLTQHAHNSSYVIFNMRSRFISYTQQVPELSKTINQGLYSLAPFTKREIKLIIDYRLSKCNLVLSGNLREILFNDINKAKVTYRQVNHALNRTVDFWQKGSMKENVIDEDFYLKTGGLKKALNNHAEEVYQDLREEGLEEVAESIFRFLMDARNMNEPLLRVYSVKQLSTISGFSVNKVLHTLQAFRQAKCPVLKYDNTGAGLNEHTLVQIMDFHVIKQWQRLQQWYEDENVSVTFFLWLVSGAQDYFNNTGSLYQGALLTQTLQWQLQEKPGKAWGDQYSEGYEKAMKFLELSEEARKKEQQSEQIAQKRRNKVLNYSVLGVILLLALAFAIYGLVSSNRAATEQEEARKSKRLNQANNLILLAKDLRAKDPTLALRLAQKAREFSDENYIENTIRRIYSENNFYNIINEMPEEVRTLKLSPNENFIVAGAGKKAYIMDMQGKNLNVLTGHTRDINSIDISQNGQKIITGSLDNTCRIWDLNGKTLHVLERHTARIQSCAFSPTGKFIATAGSDKKVILWNAEGKHLKTLFDGTASAFDLAFSPDGSKLLVGCGDHQARMFNLDGKLIGSYKHPNKRVLAVSFSQKGDRVLTANRYKFYMWDAKGKKMQTFSGHKNYVNHLFFSSDDRYVISASSDKSLRLWNLQGTMLQEFLGHNHRILASDIFKNGRKIISGSKDNTIRLWKIDYNKISVYTGHSNEVSAVIPSPEGISFISASWDHTARLFHPLKGTKTIYKGHDADLSRVVSIKDGHELLTASDDGTVIRWKRNGEILQRYRVHDNVVSGLAVSPDEKHFATSSWDNTARLWSMDGKLQETFTGHLGSVYDVAFGPEGQYICTGSRDQTARIWDLNGNLKNVLRGHTARIADVDFSPDSSLILTASWDNTAILWDYSGSILQQLKGHEGYVNAADFSNKGNYIVTASFDKTAKLWDIKGNQLQSFRGHKGFVRDVAFSVEDKFILTASSDKTTRIWKIRTPVNAFLKKANFEQLNNFQLFKYEVIDIENLIKTANEKELLQAAEYCINNSRNFHAYKTKIKWLKRGSRLFKKAYTFYHREAIQQKIAHVYGLQIRFYLMLEEFEKALSAFHSGIEESPEEKLLRRYEPLVYLLNGSSEIAMNVYRKRMYEEYDQVLQFKDVFIMDIENLKKQGVSLKAFDTVTDFLMN